MKHKEQHDGLTRLGEELLKEFEAAEKVQVSPEFDREWRGNLSREKKHPVMQVVRWTATAAVLAFAMVGVLTVAALSIDSLRRPLLEYAALHFVQEEEIRVGEPEGIPEYHQISYLGTDNIALEVYSDGNDNYQLLWSNELGRRLYNFYSPELDEEFFRDLGEQLLPAED